MNRSLRPDQTVEEATRDMRGTGTSNPDRAYAAGLVGMGISLCSNRFLDPDNQKTFGDILGLADNMGFIIVASI